LKLPGTSHSSLLRSNLVHKQRCLVEEFSSAAASGAAGGQAVSLDHPYGLGMLQSEASIHSAVSGFLWLGTHTPVDTVSGCTSSLSVLCYSWDFCQR